MKKFLGDRLNSLAVRDHLSDGALVEAAFVVMKVVDEDGDVGLATAWSEGMDFVTKRGMLEYALDAERVGFSSQDVDDD